MHSAIADPLLIAIDEFVERRIDVADHVRIHLAGRCPGGLSGEADSSIHAAEIHPLQDHALSSLDFRHTQAGLVPKEVPRTISLLHFAVQLHLLTNLNGLAMVLQFRR